MYHLFFLQQQWLHPDQHMKGFWSVRKNPQFPPKNAQLFTRKTSVIFVDFELWCFPLSTGITWIIMHWKLCKFLSLERKSYCFSDYFWYTPIRHKIVDVSMLEISNERQGKIFDDPILQTLKLFPAFLWGYLLQYSPRYGFMKINTYLSQPKKICFNNENKVLELLSSCSGSNSNRTSKQVIPALGFRMVSPLRRRQILKLNNSNRQTTDFGNFPWF